MVGWKIRSKIYHMMTPDTGDSLEKETIIEEWEKEEIEKRACDYALKDTQELYYPGKAYAVATVFAILLSKNFANEPIYYLKDPELLAGNDPYFVPFNESNRDIYYNLLIHYDDILYKTDPSLYSENFKKTLDYFYKEFLLHDETRHLLSS